MNVNRTYLFIYYRIVHRVHETLH